MSADLRALCVLWGLLLVLLLVSCLSYESLPQQHYATWRPTRHVRIPGARHTVADPHLPGGPLTELYQLVVPEEKPPADSRPPPPSALEGLPLAATAVATLLLAHLHRTLRPSSSVDPSSPSLSSLPPGAFPTAPLRVGTSKPTPLVAPHLDGPAGTPEAPPSRVAHLIGDEDEEEFRELQILPVSEAEYCEEAIVVEYNQTGVRPPVQRVLKTGRQCRALATPPRHDGTLRWVNVTGTQHALKLEILRAYNVHPLFIEDILNEAERAKVENLGPDHLVFVFQSVGVVEEPGPEDDDEDDIGVLKLEMSQVSLVLQETALLSFFTAPTRTVEQCRALIASGGGGKLRTSSAHWLMHLIIDKEVDRLFPIMNRYRAQLESIQRALDHRRRPRRTGDPNAHSARLLHALNTTTREMNNLLFVLRPLASSVASMTEHARHRDLRELQWHFNDLRDHIATILDYAASMQAWARALKDDYAYIQQDSLNRTMYALTLLTALFIPAQFLTGLFGMNFRYMPWLNWKYGFLAFWGAIAAINGAIIYLFKKIRWL